MNNLLRDLTARLRPEEQTPPAPDTRGKGSALLVAGAAFLGGMAAMYFLDPRQGSGRRNQALDRAAGTARRTARRADQTSRFVGAKVYGVQQSLRHLGPDANAPENDAVLKGKVESILFRDPDVPKGEISIHAENGTVVLKGTAHSPAQVNDIERRVAEIDGVRDVRNMLHLPNQPDRQWQETVLSQRGGS